MAAEEDEVAVDGDKVRLECLCFHHHLNFVFQYSKAAKTLCSNSN